MRHPAKLKSTVLNPGVTPIAANGLEDESRLPESLPELGVPPEEAALLQTEQLERALYSGGLTSGLRCTSRVASPASLQKLALISCTSQDACVWKLLCKVLRRNKPAVP